MKSIILEQSAHNFFEQASMVETESPNGEWRYFKFISSDKVRGVYESLKDEDIENGINLHPDFFKYFLGQFTPGLNNKISIYQSSSFNDFCEKLNSFLFKDVEIYDLSVHDLWIWSNSEASMSIPSKLKSHLSFD